MKFGDWINRKRHNRGFGIQSPSSFFFITQVLKERLPYYAYTELDKAIGGGRLKRKHFRELFRITNYLHPTSCISIGSVEATCTMISARPSVKHYLVAPNGITDEAQALLNTDNCNIIESTEQLPALFEQLKSIGILYISISDNSDSLIRAALTHTNNSSVIIVDGINSNKAAREWWQQIVNDSKIVVTYDMYGYGMLFFDKERRKQNYTLKR